MTAESFAAWLAACQAAGIIRGHGARRDAAALLGKSEDTIRRYKTDGTTERQTDLACAAILAGLEPFGE